MMLSRIIGADGKDANCSTECCRQDGFDYCIVKDKTNIGKCSQLETSMCQVHKEGALACQLNSDTNYDSLCFASSKKETVHFTTSIDDTCESKLL